MKHIRMAFTLICIFALLGPAAADDRSMRRNVPLSSSTGQTTPLYKDSYALVVGNGAYTGGFDPLRGALRDVKDVAAALEKQGFTVSLKTNLTRDGFLNALNEFVLVQGRQEENRLLFYYAGHGYTRQMSNDEDLGYLVMVDAPDPDKDPVGFSRSSVDMQTMITQAKMIKARHALFMFDSCFSGTVLDLRERVTPQAISDNARNHVRQFITAGRANEPVPDQSVFKQAFLDLLEGREPEPIPDGYITGEELGLYLKNKVPYYNKSQHPQYGKIRDPKLDKGDFVFLASGQAVVDKPQPVVTSTASLLINSRPTGALVHLGGAKKGKAPISMSDLTPGKIRVRVELDGYVSQEKQVELQAGRETSIEFLLDPVRQEASVPRAGDTWTDPVTGMVFVWVPGGSFDMGSPDGETGRGSDEGPVHRVELDGFWMGKTEVTVGQYMPFAQESGQYPEWKEAGNEYNIQTGSKDLYKNLGSALTAENYPVVGVSWNNAKAYAQWLSGKTDKTFRLPSEAQWEYACRAGRTTARFWGNNPADACRYANVDDGTHKCSDGYKYTSPVGSFQPNPFWLYDMLGNVWEWVEDVYIADIYGRSDKKNPIYTSGGTYGSNRVIRGGSWLNAPVLVRCAYRLGGDPAGRSSSVGFRLLRIL